MKKDEVRFTLRVPPDLLAKLDYVAEYEGRSRNSEILRALRSHISGFESRVEKIDLKDQ